MLGDVDPDDSDELDGSEPDEIKRCDSTWPTRFGTCWSEIVATSLPAGS